MNHDTQVSQAIEKIGQENFDALVQERIDQEPLEINDNWSVDYARSAACNHKLLVQREVAKQVVEA